MANTFAPDSQAAAHYRRGVAEYAADARRFGDSSTGRYLLAKAELLAGVIDLAAFEALVPSTPCPPIASPCAARG